MYRMSITGKETPEHTKKSDIVLDLFIRPFFLKNLLSSRFTIKLGNIMPSLKKKNATKKAKHEAKTGK